MTADRAMKIRKATVHDIRDVQALILAATKRGKILKRSLADLKKAIHHFWVIEHEGRVVACCARGWDIGTTGSSCSRSGVTAA